VKNFRGPIGGLVVYGNDFNDFRLRGKRCDAGGDGHFFVAGWDDGSDASGGIHSQDERQGHLQEVCCVLIPKRMR
jgi:hypothetical protein